MSEESGPRGADSCLVIFRSGKTGAFRSRRKLPTQKIRLAALHCEAVRSTLSLDQGVIMEIPDDSA